MELVVSSIAGDLVSRFISFIIKKYNSQVNLKEKMGRLQQLLLRVHMVVEEAEGRHLTNSKMLLELKKLSEAMYQGYHVLDTASFGPFASQGLRRLAGLIPSTLFVPDGGPLQLITSFRVHWIV
jgi:hypothetical protein